MLLANRKWSVTIDGQPVNEDFRMSFHVRKTLTPAINTAEIKIWNMPKNVRGQLKRRKGEGHRIQLSAGYLAAYGSIFQGVTEYISHDHSDRINWVSSLVCGDGAEAREVFINEAFGPGTTVADVVLTIAQATGLDFTALLPQLSLFSQSQTAVFQSGYTTVGNAIQALNTLLIAVGGFRWTIEDGSIFVIPKNGVMYPGLVYVLGKNTGLVGSPSRTEIGFNARALLNPNIKIGSLVQAVSREGNYSGRVDAIDYRGDTYGNEWYADLECRDIADPLLDDLDYLIA